jgi:hypothetical protein
VIREPFEAGKWIAGIQLNKGWAVFRGFTGIAEDNGGIHRLGGSGYEIYSGNKVFNLKKPCPKSAKVTRLFGQEGFLPEML